MKLNERILKEMIKDVLKEADPKLGDTAGKASASDVRRGAIDQAKEQASGLTNDERGLIRDLVAIMAAAAKKTNLKSGPSILKINQLAAVLRKVAATEQDQGQQPQQGATQ